MARKLSEAEVTAWMRHIGMSEEQIAAEVAAHEQRHARPRIAALMAEARYWARALYSPRRWHRDHRAVDAMHQWAESHPGLIGQQDQAADTGEG
jgi:N-acyl-D-aspartate/D-glutamate deacylase